MMRLTNTAIYDTVENVLEEARISRNFAYVVDPCDGRCLVRYQGRYRRRRNRRQFNSAICIAGVAPSLLVLLDIV